MFITNSSSGTTSLEENNRKRYFSVSARREHVRQPMYYFWMIDGQKSQRSDSCNLIRRTCHKEGLLCVVMPRWK